MRTCEEDDSSQKQPNPTELGFNSSDHTHVSHVDPFSDQPLDPSFVNGFQNLTLHKYNDTQEKESGNIDGADYNGTKYEYPLRPYAEDCPFYLKTGRCKFGMACKFNHPERKAYQVSKVTIFMVVLFYLNACDFVFGACCNVGLVFGGFLYVCDEY